jgi:tetratricopeptide (TPR) repeat protein
LGPETQTEIPQRGEVSEPKARFRVPTVALCAALAAAVLAAYGNHFFNDFHFDDSHTIANNIFIKKLGNIPRFFTDAATFSMQPEGQTWRPLVSTSVAIDYAIAGGLKPFAFHLSTFVWFEVQLVLMFFLFRRILDAAGPHPWNIWTALAATACYGLHPAMAETVNYIIQRGDLYSTLGVVASLLLFIAYPAQRKYCWYMLPAIAAYLSKAPALIFPLILLAYVFLFEREPGAGGKELVRATWPAFAITAIFALISNAMTPATFNAGAISESLYRITQPWVALHYFKSFFLPTELSADSDWTYVQPFSPQALAGYLFVAAMLWAAYYTSRRREMRPISFGILWFFLAQLPTALMPLAEVTNDHRMFFPFVGLVLAVFSAARLVLANRPAWVRAGVALVAVALFAEAAGTHQRNQVWRSEDTLWRDVAMKSPKNARGLMTYATTLMTHGEVEKGLSYLERAAALSPLDFLPEMNLGVAYGALRRNDDADRHFLRAIVLAPNLWEPHFYYGRWLESQGAARIAEAQREVETAVKLNRLSFQSRNLLMQIYEETGNNQALEALAQETMKLANEDLPKPSRQVGQPTGVGANPNVSPSDQAAMKIAAEDTARQAAQECRAGNYDVCIEKAKHAIELKPDYPEAMNVLAMALFATGHGDEGIETLQKALRINPEYQTAKKNLEWALEERRKHLDRSAESKQ